MTAPPHRQRWLDVAGRTVAERVGFALSAAQWTRLQRAVTDLAAQHGVSPPTLASGLLPGTPDFDHLIDAVVVGETYWFRDPAQLEAIVAHLDDVEPAHRSVWIVGCSTGQEVWSLAITARRAGVWPLRITASDISRSAVDTVGSAVYDLDRQRGLDPDTAARSGTHLSHGRWQVDEELRAAVTTRHHNVVVDAPLPAQAILCRNVLIYFSPTAVATAMRRFAAALEPGGVLVLGHAEGQLTGQAWHARPQPGTFVFQPAVRGASGRGSARAADRRPAGEAHPVRSWMRAEDLLRRGEAALSTGRVEEAIGLLRSARCLESSDPVPAVVLGMALARAGRTDEARGAWEEAVELLDALPPDAVLVGGYLPLAVRQWILTMSTSEQP